MPKRLRKTKIGKKPAKIRKKPKKMVDEVKLLEKGHVPDTSKIGSGFKGKNKIIIS
ncbi:MAG: hypothetical protein NT129_06330 [Candidatus Aenigmarchaeota archaeon]|nr:hypothetical protein [Candidatus Aenigmarchaeota archaeon]